MSDKGKGKARPPTTTTTPPQQLSFVTSTSNLDNFKDKDIMRQVRKTVMHSYLDKALDDPSSTDVRVRNRRPGTRGRKGRSDLTQPTGVQPSPPPPPPPEPQPQPPSAQSQRSSPSLRRDSYIDDTSLFRLEHHDSYPTPGASSVASSQVQPSITFAFDEPLIPPLRRPSPPSTFQGSPGPDSFSDGQVGGMSCESYFSQLAEAKAFLTAYTHARDERQRERGNGNDPFADAPDLPKTLNIGLLKSNCTKYFGSRAMAKQWVPLQLQSPEAFLASLCISAPYTDLMALSGHEPKSKYRPESEQTLEVLDIVPRMIHEKLNDVESSSSDANIVAITQLFCGQLSSQYTDVLASHPGMLKMLVQGRGGLDKLGGNGVIAMNVVVTNLEANLLQDQRPDPYYLDWAKSYLASKPQRPRLAPEGPLCSTTTGMRSFANHKWCLPQTLQLVLEMHGLTEATLQLGRLQADLVRSQISSIRNEEMENLRRKIRDAVYFVYNLPDCYVLGQLGPEGWIYETVRLTSLLYSHAISSRLPLHEAIKSPIDTTSQEQKSLGTQYQATPEMIHDALEKTPVKETWGRLAGVLYWVLMVSASACHAPVTQTSSEGASPNMDDVSPASFGRDVLRRKVKEPTRSGSAPADVARGGFAPPPAPRSSAQDTTQPIRSDFDFSLDSSSVRNTEFQSAYTTAPANSSLPVPVPIHPFGNPGRLFQEYLDESAARGTSPNSLQSNPVNSARDAGTWTAPHSRPASGSHTPSPPSSVPSSVGGGMYSSTLPTTSSFDFSSLYSGISAPKTSYPNPTSTSQPDRTSFPSATSPPAVSTGVDSALSWDTWASNLFTDDQVPFTQTTQPLPQSTLSTSQFQAPPPPARPTTTAQSQTDRGKRLRRAVTSTTELVKPEQAAKEQRAYVKRYLTANAVRVSILLRFEHTAAVVGGVLKMGECQRYLNGN